MRDIEVKAEEANILSEQTRKRKREEYYGKAMLTVLKEQNIDVDAINSVEDSKAKDSEIERVNIRKELIDSKPDESFITPPFPFEKAHSAWYEDVLLKPYFTRVHRGSGTEGGGIGDVREVLIKEGEGTGIWATASKGPLEIDRWFTFIPPKTGFHSLQIFQPFNGFYIARADDGWLTSKYVRLTVDAVMKAHQYYWHPEIKLTVKTVGGYHVDAVGRIDDVFSSFYQDTFVLGDRVYFLVTQRLDCIASGDDSYAELNFKDGISNVLHAPFLKVIPPS
jgi:hypothetical protein